MFDADISSSITQLNEYVKKLIENDESLRYIWVKGEISNYKIASNKHAYFSLKDDKSMVNAVMFSDYVNKIKFTPKDGDEVKVLCSVTVYPPRGTYSLRVYEMSVKGEGEILLELEKLKKQLQKEGLFDVSKKRSINRYPQTIGVITALNSAAMKDIVTNIKRRYPIADIYIFPSAVQGEGASKELLDTFNRSQTYNLDTLIIARGGGSSEDLTAFNNESLVRAVANRKTPVISAIGHEVDTTLLDLVSDVRVSTPTAAAELATVDQRDIQERLIDISETMKDSLLDKIEELEDELEEVTNSLNDEINDIIINTRRDLSLRKEAFISLSPLGILSRGYSLTTSKDGKVISKVNAIKENEEIITVLEDGKVISVVKSIKGE
jgi:exodeoxyribonuclease VII large subunit